MAEEKENMERFANGRLAVLGSQPSSLGGCSAIIAIPARNEADRIRRCLAALAVQRDRLGAPVQPGTFGVLLLVNNTTDATARIASEMIGAVPYPLEVVIASLTRSATAGGARRAAMELAADRMQCDPGEGALLTTDADSLVTPSWFSDNIRHLTSGADCVAGYIDAEAAEIVSLGPLFLSRGRFEDAYLRLVAEIYARCDPRPHDPWPNHRVSSGASLAVKLSAYRSIGGMPDLALGEDGAFTARLDLTGFKVRHALDVAVSTSCRLDGRASGGAADTMRHRRDVPNAPCDDEIEPASSTVRRATFRGYLRKAHEGKNLPQAIMRLLGDERSGRAVCTFADAWTLVEAKHPKLRRGPRLRPSDLPRQIIAAEFILRHLRTCRGRTTVPTDKYLHEVSVAPVDA